MSDADALTLELVDDRERLARITDNVRHQPLLFAAWERDAIALAQSIVAEEATS